MMMKKEETKLLQDHIEAYLKEKGFGGEFILLYRVSHQDVGLCANGTPPDTAIFIMRQTADLLEQEPPTEADKITDTQTH